MRAVVFDMEGVIFDSERLVLECWKEIADRRGSYGEDFPYDEFRKEASVLFHERYDNGWLLKYYLIYRRLKDTLIKLHFV